MAAAADSLRQAGFEAEGVVCDVGNRASVDAAVASAVARFGRLDVAVANAGIVRSAGGLGSTWWSSCNGALDMPVPQRQL